MTQDLDIRSAADGTRRRPRPLARYVTRKACWYLLTFVIAVSLNFILPRLIPGNPISVIAAKMMNGMPDHNTQKAIYDAFMKDFGLDQPLWRQFLIYWGKLLRGDLGISIGHYPRTVASLISSALPWTIGLQLPAILLGWILGNVLGVFTAYRKGVFDSVIYPASLFVHSVPFFAMSIIILYFLAIEGRLFPIGGGYAITLMEGLSLPFVLSVIRHHTLPFLSIVLVFIGGQAIGMRSMSIYELNTDYVQYCRFMGIRDGKIERYIFRNAMLPQITGLSIILGTMVSGALITEIVFNYPGLGTWMFDAIRQQDFTLIAGCTLVITIAVLLGNFAIDIIYGFIDPRIRAAQSEEM